MIETIELEPAGTALRVRWREGTETRLPAIWLRDNAQDPGSRHPGNGQRLFTILDLPVDLRLQRVELVGDAIDVLFAPEGHEARFEASWLRAMLSEEERPPLRLWG